MRILLIPFRLLALVLAIAMLFLFIPVVIALYPVAKVAGEETADRWFKAYGNLFCTIHDFGSEL